MVENFLEGKDALITGGASGFGRGVAYAFAERGANLVLVDINEELLEETAKDVAEKTGRKVIPIVLQEELESRPEELNVISESWGGLLKLEEVAEKYVEGLLKKIFYVMPGSSKFLWRMMRLFPKLVHKISDGDLRKSRKKLKERSN